MNITLKNVKHIEKLSEETHCFSATVYLNGKKVFGVKNAGHGGEDEIYPVTGGAANIDDMYHTIDKELGKEKCEPPYESLDNCLQIVVGDLVNEFLRDKEIKKSLRNILYTYGDGSDVFVIKANPTTENITRVKQQKWWKDKYTILNTMPIEEVRQYFK